MLYNFVYSLQKICLAGFFIAFLLSPCQKANSHDQNYPRFVTSHFGTIRIAAPPQRVITIGNASEDILLALGITPLAIEGHFWGGNKEGYLPWFAQALAQKKLPPPQILQTYPEIDIETIAKLKPDLIIAVQSGLTEAQYRSLSYFAPVIGYKDKAWRTPITDQIRIIAYAVNKEAKGEELIAIIEQNFAKLRQKLNLKQNYRFAFVKANPTLNSLLIYVKSDPRIEILSKLGFTLAPSVATAKGGFHNFAHSISLERVDTLDDVDILFTWYLNKEEQKLTETSPLFQSLYAVKNGIYIPILDPALNMSLLYGSPLSIIWGCDKIVNLLQQKISAHNAQH